MSARRGSRYKLFELARRALGEGRILKIHVNDASPLREFLKKARPCLLVVQGDTCPAWVEAVKERIPYVVIAGDVASWSRGGPHMLPGERDMLEGAKAVLFTSEYHLSYCIESGYELPPFAVVYNRPLWKDIENIAIKPRRENGNRIVYAGGVTREGRGELWGYRVYIDIFRELISKGWEVHVYNALKNDLTDRAYSDIGCKTHPGIDQWDLYQELSKYDVGFQGYNTKGVPPSVIDYAFHCKPNKFWEYMGAGIPTLGFQAGLGKRVYHGKWGTVVDSIPRPEEVEFPEFDETIRKEQTTDQDEERVAALLRSTVGHLVCC